MKFATSRGEGLRAALEAIREKARLVRGGRYFVKRGWLVWSAFPFDVHERGLSITVAFSRFLEEDGHPGEAEVTLALAARIEDSPDPGLDDGVVQEMIDDARWVVREAARQREDGYRPFTALHDSTSTVQEFHDDADRVQGVVASFRLRHP